MPPPNQVLKLIERFERNLDEYKRPDYKEARVRAEQHILPLHQKLTAAILVVVTRGQLGYTDES